jgi:hypothetical protein
MSSLVHRVTWVRALMVIGLVYASFFLLYRQSDWAGFHSDVEHVGELDLPPTLEVEPAGELPLDTPPVHVKPAHEEALDKLWDPAQLDPKIVLVLVERLAADAKGTRELTSFPLSLSRARLVRR